MQPTAGLEVTTAYSPWAFLLGIVRPRVVLDGAPPLVWRWGTATVPVSPGCHRVECFFRWGLFPVAGRGVLDVDVPAGGLVRLRYVAPTWFVFSRGQLTHEGTVALGAINAGWQPDPSGRHSLRYWDGSAWTPHVSTNDVATTDVLG